MSVANARVSGGTFWALVPVLLLAASLAGVGTMATIASRDPSFSLEHDYYDRAVHWDREQAQARDNQRLGYRLSLGFARSGEVTAELAHRDGSPLRGAAVRAEAFANARAAHVQKLVFVESAAGTYSARLQAPRAGLWEFRFQVRDGSDLYTEVVRADVAGGGAGQP